jgi:hypothetical protein
MFLIENVTGILKIYAGETESKVSQVLQKLRSNLGEDSPSSPGAGRGWKSSIPGV